MNWRHTLGRKSKYEIVHRCWNIAWVYRKIYNNYYFNLNKKLIKGQINDTLRFRFCLGRIFCDCEILNMMFSPGWYDLKLSPLYWFRCWYCMWLELLVLCPAVSSFSLVFLWFFSGLPQSPKFDLIWWDLGWFLLFPIRRGTVLNLIHFDLKKVIARYYYYYYCYYSYHCFFLWNLALFTNLAELRTVPTN